MGERVRECLKQKDLNRGDLIGAVGCYGAKKDAILPLFEYDVI